jgi:hypothetical protein
MRKDMSKVIVERPRVGRSWAGRKPGRTRVVADDDGEPLRTARGAAREPVRPPRKTKSLNENLNPLRRYLAAQVGRPWNKVFAEISEHLKPTSTVQQHVRDHLEDFVAVKTRMRGGKVVLTPRFGGERPLDEDWRHFYVHPRTGLLRLNERRTTFQRARRLARERAAVELAQRMRALGPMTQAHLFGEGWWEVKLAKIRGAEPFVDVVARAKLSTLAPDILYGRHGVYACEKRPLSRTEMKRLGLR